MNPISIAGAFIITISLLTYGVGTITLQRFKMITPVVVWFLSIGVFLDIVATIFMIIGSQNTPFTLHGLLGYSAFLVMFTVLIFVLRAYKKNGKDSLVSRHLYWYSKWAYGWWVITYFTGSLLVIFK